MNLLDQLDDRRHDTLAILGAANEFGQFTDAEQDETEGGLWSYAGLGEAEHPLTSLLRESHNATRVVRDLDGTLQLLVAGVLDLGSVVARPAPPRELDRRWSARRTARG